MEIQQPNQQQPIQQPEPSIQPNPVINQPPNNIWKIVVLVIIGVLVLGGASYSAYYYWQNNKPVVAPIDETANWQTYKNDKYGFEFKYPIQFYVVSQSPNSVSLDDVKNKNQDRFGRYTTATVSEESSFENFLSRLVNDMTGEKLNITKQEKISGDPILYKIYVGNSGSFHGVAVKGNAYVYIVPGSGPDVNQILSTFKFTK